MSINWVEVAGQMAEAIAEDFPDSAVEKLQALTGEEMFYLTKLLEYEPEPGRKPDIMFLVLKQRARLWLQGKRPRHGLPFEHLQKYWQEDFFLAVS